MESARAVWADLHAKHTSAIWKCVDARKRAALAFPGSHAQRTAEAELEDLICKKDEAARLCMEARSRMEEEER